MSGQSCGLGSIFKDVIKDVVISLKSPMRLAAMVQIYGIFGAGGHGREVMPLAYEQLLAQGKNLDHLFYVVDRPTADKINGIHVLSLNEYLHSELNKCLSICVADSQFRSHLVQKLRDYNITYWTIVANNSIIRNEVTMGDGAIISPFVTITSNVTIGCSFHANMYSYVAHDCVIGDFVTFAPAVKCNGNVVIEDHVYVGAGAMIRQGLTIGTGAFIGMGAVVTKDVPSGVMVVGNPARILKNTPFK